MQGCTDKAEQANPDPSACHADASLSCQSSSTCGHAFAGVACDYDQDCASSNCYQGHCYTNANGQPCDYDQDCTSNSCTNRCCQGNGAGSPCDYDQDCDSNNCANSRCQ